MIGIDLARGLAVLGMFLVHVGPDPEEVGGWPGWLLGLANGRSSALFALLAGVSLAIITGSQQPRTGLRGRQAAVRIAVRAAILLVLGTVLMMMASESVSVILAYYGMYFLLALPFLRLRALPLAVLSAAVAVVGPVLALLADSALSVTGWETTLDSVDPVTQLSDDGLAQLLLTGSYPALPWMAYVFAGMAIGRMDLRAHAVRIRLLLVGPVLALAGYGGSWLAAALTAVPVPAEDSEETGGLTSLLFASPHSATPFELIGNIGVAIMVVAALLLAVDALPRLRKAAWPVLAVGTMSLTVYTAHVVSIWIIESVTEDPEPAYLLPGFVAGAMIFATLWLHHFRRGPLEQAMNSATALAR